MRRLTPASTLLRSGLVAALALLSCKGAADKDAAPNITAAVTTLAGSLATQCACPASPTDTAPVVLVGGDEDALPCRIEPRTVLTLDNAAFDIDHMLANIVRNSRGEYIVAGRGNVLALLDAPGKLIRKFGRDDSGPGEFRRINPLHVDAAETVYVFDGSQRRLTVIDPVLSHLVRTTAVKALSGNQSVLPRPQSQWLAGGQISTGMQPDTSFNTLHILSAEGNIVRGWNAATMAANRAARNQSRGTRELPGRGGPVMGRTLSPSANDSVLIARANSYTIEQWAKDFARARTFERSVAWFPTLQQDAMFRIV